MTAVSVIVPAYRSERTLPRHLACLRAQRFRDFELIVVDSSPEDRAGEIVAREMPEARYVHSPVRLWAQAARNEGARHARGELLVFTDPDIYPPPNWLDAIVAAREDGRQVVLGPIACHGDRWLHRGAHLTKFAICLPGGTAREVALGWSGNIAVPRALFDAAGGWEAGFFQGDSVLTERLRRAGHALWLDPRCVVDHDHDGLTLRSFLEERFRRGREFAAMELAGALRGGRWSQRGLGTVAAVPLRVGSALLRIARAARDAGSVRELATCAPVVILGVAAWYGGMTRTYLGASENPTNECADSTRGTQSVRSNRM